MFDMSPQARHLLPDTRHRYRSSDSYHINSRLEHSYLNANQINLQMVMLKTKRILEHNREFIIVGAVLALILLVGPPVQATALSRSPATLLSSNDATASAAIKLREIVRHTRNNGNNNDHQYETHPQQHPPIPPNYVKLGNNTSSNRAFNFANGQHHLRTPITNQSMTTLSDQSRIDESQASQKKSLFEKICIGTSNRMSGQSNKTDHYQNLVERYRNCTYVIGNLEITWLEKTIGNRPLDLTFLESIREITGYLLIAYVEVERIRLPNLQIIRGRELFKLNTKGAKEEFAMFVMQNKLKSLEMPNLREILAGDVGFYDNYDLCHIRTIEWGEILNSGFMSRYILNATVPDPVCPPCHDSCHEGHCWGPEPESCQKFSKITCSAQCDQGRCFGPAPRECCHLFCAGGCTGPKQTDCLACKNFNNDGECIQECPPMRKYNPSKFLWEADPNGKYAFGATCVKECPDHLLRDNGACVRSCPPDKRSQNGECVPCVGPCPKNCQGVDVVNSHNIELLVNCTEIEGSITILDSSFKGYSDVLGHNTMGVYHEPMHPSRLKVFDSIRSITGHLNIQADHPDFKDLSFFSKLETIEGRQTTDMFYSLTIIKTSLVSLNLRSLRRVRGKILIEENKNLCFANATLSVKNGIEREEDITIRNNGDNRHCRSLGLKCHEQCSHSNCWGPGQNECLSCTNYKLEDYCVQNCTSTRQIGILSFDSGNKTCSKCHPECRGGCSSSSARNCWACKNYKDGPYCVSECPNHKYNDDGVCQECHRNCVDGCTGPSNKLDKGGCNSCDKFVVDSISPTLVARCIKIDEPCPEGYYQEYGAPVSDKHPLKPLERRPICRKCHLRCKSCNGYGTHKDVCECAGYVANDQCEDSCPRDFFADEKSRRCIRCSRECNGCFGPTEADCLSCRVYRIYHDQNGGPTASARVSEKTPMGNLKPTGNFSCTAQCPPEKPYRISESNLLDPYCSEDPGPDSDNPRVVSVGSTSFLLLLITSASITFCVMVHKCKTDKDKLSTVKLTMRLSGFDDVEPLNQSNLKPNLAPLRSIKKTELRLGDEIGSGVGGTVYQGEWYPEGQEHRDPTYVAIKVLRDNGQSNMNKEFLDEAYIMASVNHPNLVKLLAVCMTPTELILVTPLMPVGCLLDYVRKNQQEITVKNLLEWGKQIAKGMAYLEEHRMVHRDLALRNVLLQTKQRALISDFGLAKFLEVDQSEYKVDASGGTRLPIKWLAPECIRERKFTHKSDVWAFGVTIWELVTFGKRPFENIATNEVFMAVEQGTRLEKPSYVALDVYKVMMACWSYNPVERPDFKSLAENFVHFARDPERYLKCNKDGKCDISLRSSESDDNTCANEYDSESDSIEEETSPPLSARPDLNHQHNGLTEMFGFMPRQHNSESETPNGHTRNYPATNHHHMLEDVFSMSTQLISTKSSNATITDSNNNFTSNNIGGNSGARSNADSCWTVNHTVSMNSLGHRSEQPTDSDDYLMPSPCSNEEKFSKFLNNHERHQSNRLPPRPPSSHDPPHSAGLIGISNQEYFLTRLNYANSNGTTNASSGHIPQSLV